MVDFFGVEAVEVGAPFLEVARLRRAPRGPSFARCHAITLGWLDLEKGIVVTGARPRCLGTATMNIDRLNPKQSSPFRPQPAVPRYEAEPRQKKHAVSLARSHAPMAQSRHRKSTSIFAISIASSSPTKASARGFSSGGWPLARARRKYGGATRMSMRTERRAGVSSGEKSKL